MSKHKTGSPIHDLRAQVKADQQKPWAESRAKEVALVRRDGDGNVLFYECPRYFLAMDPKRGCENGCNDR